MYNNDDNALVPMPESRRNEVNATVESNSSSSTMEQVLLLHEQQQQHGEVSQRPLQAQSSVESVESSSTTSLSSNGDRKRGHGEAVTP